MSHSPSSSCRRRVVALTLVVSHSRSSLTLVVSSSHTLTHSHTPHTHKPRRTHHTLVVHTPRTHSSYTLHTHLIHTRHTLVAPHTRRVSSCRLVTLVALASCRRASSCLVPSSHSPRVSPRVSCRAPLVVRVVRLVVRGRLVSCRVSPHPLGVCLVSSHPSSCRRRSSPTNSPRERRSSCRVCRLVVSCIAPSPCRTLVAPRRHTPPRLTSYRLASCRRVSPRLVSPRRTPPRSTSPRRVSPRRVPSCLVGRHGEPRSSTSSCVVSPHTTSCRVASCHLASCRTTSPPRSTRCYTSPRLVSCRVAPSPYLVGRFESVVSCRPRRRACRRVALRASLVCATVSGASFVRPRERRNLATNGGRRWRGSSRALGVQPPHSHPSLGD